MRKSKFTKEEKAQILTEGINSRMSIADICAKHGISIATYYTWKRKIPVNPALEIEQCSSELKQQNRTLRKLYIDLSEHNYQLAQFLSQ